MAIFTMSDLHLSLDSDKPMDVFGYAWDNYINRIYDNWNSVVGSDDTVLVGGDISWAMHLEECYKDFDFLNNLPGKKLLFKGNHDYWWESVTKMNAFVEKHNFSTISFMHNNAVIVDDTLITGTRGWILPDDSGFGSDDEKIYKRELARLELSLKYGRDICLKENSLVNQSICILHYPPFTKDHKPDKCITDMLSLYNITHCFYGHLHSMAAQSAFEGEYGGITYRLVSADHLQFSPIKT